jgi:isoleucyl-tRNA synthetase
VVLLADEDRAALGLSPIVTGLKTMPVEVPRAAVGTRVMIEDERTPAPGADAFRWFFYAASPPWSNTRHSLSNVRLLQKDFQVKLRNVYSFFTIYANIDGWSPDKAAAARPAKDRSELDRWMLSELSIAVRDAQKSLDAYMVYDAAQRLVELVEGLSNWYVRRSRARFWAPGLEQEKLDAYATLYEALSTLARMAAPFIPFFSEEMYQNLVVGPKVAGAKESVHLEAYPEPQPGVIDEALSREMAAVREVVSLGLSVRTQNRLKVRQPLSRADVVFNDGAIRDRLARHEGLIAEELNVHEVHFMFPGHEDGAVAFKLKPNFRALGPRLGKQVQAVKKALEGADGGQLHAELSKTGKITLTVDGQALDFSPEEIDIAVEASDGFAAQTGGVGVVVLHTTLTDELVDEGILREIVSRVQATRKEMQLEFTDRIRLNVGGSERVRRIAEKSREHIARECLATDILVSEDAAGAEHTMGDETVTLGVQKS